MIEHDRLFKELISTFFVEFVELFLPELAKYLDPNSIVMLDKEIFTDMILGERYEADLVVKAKFLNTACYFLVHFENQSYPQSDFARRMFRYFSLFYDKYDLPIYPVAIFSYDTPKREEPSNHKVEFPDMVILDFRFRVIQLNRLNWRDYVNKPNPIASALMAKMSFSKEERPRVKLECLRLLVTLKLDPARTKLVSAFIDTYLKLNAEEEKILNRELETINPKEKEGVMEIVTSWMETGIQQGLEKGLEQGRQEGLTEGKTQEALSLVVKLITKKFPSIELNTVEQIHNLNLEQLEGLVEDLLDFTNETDLINWLNQNE
jgi:predicted transposase YdaD